jgi:hypothetical protein
MRTYEEKERDRKKNDAFTYISFLSLFSKGSRGLEVICTAVFKVFEVCCVCVKARSSKARIETVLHLDKTDASSFLKE